MPLSRELASTDVLMSSSAISLDILAVSTATRQFDSTCMSVNVLCFMLEDLEVK